MNLTAEALARRVDPDASAEFVAFIERDADLMEIAEADPDAAFEMLVGFAIDSLFANAHAAIDALTAAKRAA